MFRHAILLGVIISASATAADPPHAKTVPNDEQDLISSRRPARIACGFTSKLKGARTTHTGMR